MAKLRNLEYYGFPEQKEFQGIKTQYSIKNDEQDTEIATLIENKLDKGEAKKTYASIEKTVSDIVYLGDEKKIVFNDANGNELGSINASEFIKDGMVSDVKIDNGNLVIAFNTDSGHDEISISLSDIFDPNNYYIKEDVDDALKLKTDDNEFKTFVSQNANEHTSLLTAIGKVKEDIDTELSNKLDVSTFNEYSGVVDTKLEEKALQSDLEALSGVVENKQDKGNYLDFRDDNGRKVIIFNNNDVLGSLPNTEPLEGKEDVTEWSSLIFMNRRNVVDVGSPRTITNINTPKDRRPTVQEAGQSELDAHKIAYLDDVEKLEARIVELENALKAINEKA